MEEYLKLLEAIRHRLIVTQGHAGELLPLQVQAYKAWQTLSDDEQHLALILSGYPSPAGH